MASDTTITDNWQGELDEWELFFNTVIIIEIITLGFHVHVIVSECF